MNLDTNSIEGDGSSPVPCSSQDRPAYDAAKVLIVTCLMNGSEKLTLDMNGFHGPLGESGDWRITCRKKRRWFLR